MSQPPDSTVGGQAVIEGVMIRSPQAWSVAVRRPDGGIETRADPLPKLSSRSRWAKVPFIRGVLVLGESLTIGFKALSWSARIAAADEEEREADRLREKADSVRGPLASWRRRRIESRIETAGEIRRGDMAIALTLAGVVFVALFMLAPLGVARLTENALGGSNAVIFNLAEGIVRVALFVGYIWLIGRSGEIKRVFQYHGAEHKSIYAYEAGDPLMVDDVQKYQTMHPRCGTSFLLIVVLLSIFVFTVVGIFEPGVVWLISSRVVLIPLIAGVSYEILKLSANQRWLAFLARPGIELQRLTTGEPADDQVEVAITSLLAALPEDALAEVKGRGPVCPAALTALAL